MFQSSEEEGSSVDQKSADDVKKLKEALWGLKDLMPDDCFQSAERLMKNCISKTPTDDLQQSLLDFFTLLKNERSDKEKKKVQQERHQLSKQTAKKSSSSSSSSWGLSSKVKVYSVVTGQAFGADQVLLDKLKNIKWTTVTVETTRDLQESDIVIAFCPITSRVGSDVPAAMTDITGSCGQKPLILVLMHHTRDVDYSTDRRSWSDVYDNVVLDVHVLFHETKSGLLKCPKNDQAVAQIQKELKNHSKWKLPWQS